MRGSFNVAFYILLGAYVLALLGSLVSIILKRRLVGRNVLWQAELETSDVLMRMAPVIITIITYTVVSLTELNSIIDSVEGDYLYPPILSTFRDSFMFLLILVYTTPIIFYQVMQKSIITDRGIYITPAKAWSWDKIASYRWQEDMLIFQIKQRSNNARPAERKWVYPYQQQEAIGELLARYLPQKTNLHPEQC